MDPIGRAHIPAAPARVHASVIQRQLSRHNDLAVIHESRGACLIEEENIIALVAGARWPGLQTE